MMSGLNISVPAEPGKTPPPAPASGIHLVELDGIRGLAVLFILIWHYVGIPGGIEPQPDRWLPSFHQSLAIFKSGVDLFFTLSGFLIAGILIDQRDAPHGMRTFFVRRFCRIFPLYYALVLIFVVARLAGAGGPLFAGTIPVASYLTMTQNYFMAATGTYGAAWLGATWSLAIEEQFYLLFPLVVRSIRERLPWFLLVGIVGAPALRIWCYRHYGNDWVAYTWLPCRMDSLCWGAMLACLVRRPEVWSLINHRRQWLRGILAVLAAGITVLGAALPRDISYHMSYWGHSLLAAFYAFSILGAVLNRGNRSTAFLRLRPLLFLGRISYGIYLVHGIALLAVFSAAGRPVSIRDTAGAGLIAVALGATLLICALSYRWLEQPFLRLGKRATYA